MDSFFFYVYITILYQFCEKRSEWSFFVLLEQTFLGFYDIIYW